MGEAYLLCKYLHIYVCLLIVFTSNMYLHFLALFICCSPKELQKLAGKEAKYDAYTYVQGAPKNGGGGVAFGGTVCARDQKQRISYTNARSAKECGKTKCTKSRRIALTSEVLFGFN